MNVWNYIRREKIDIPSLYFSHPRKCLHYHGQLIAVSDYIRLDPGDIISTVNVRYRTVGDMTCTAAIESAASTIDEVINEISRSRISERGETRIDDRISDAGMEDRKSKGYF
jgi:sulfate adenylyltransferase subunit 2